MMAASIINTDFARTHVTQTVLTVLGLSGVVAVFLPFVYDYVPGEVFLEPLDLDTCTRCPVEIALLGPHHPPVCCPFAL